MSAQPYIPIYPGDELKLCGHLPLDVYGGYMKLRFKMWDAPVRGRFQNDIKDVRRAMGADSVEDAQNIVNVLIREKILAIDGTDLIHPEMIEKERISKIRKEAGGKGGEKTQSKKKPREGFDKPFALAKEEAKINQNTENEIENDNNSVLMEKGGTGEKTIQELHAEGKINSGSNLELDDCVWMLVHSDHPLCIRARESICFRYNELAEIDKTKFPEEIIKIDIPKLEALAKVFNNTQPMVISRPLDQYTTHFSRWLKFQDRTQTPDKILENDKRLTRNSAGAASNRKTIGTNVIERNRDFRTG